MIIGRQFVENQYKEKLYSTGNDELDEMLEKAFCEGYEYAQREYSLKNKLKSIPRHIKRDIVNSKIGFKIATGKGLTNEEVGKYAAASKNSIRRINSGKDKLKSKMINLEAKMKGDDSDVVKKGADLFAKAYKEGKRAEPSFIPGYYNFVN